jgi:hypothetical protein
MTDDLMTLCDINQHFALYFYSTTTTSGAVREHYLVQNQLTGHCYDTTSKAAAIAYASCVPFCKFENIMIYGNHVVLECDGKYMAFNLVDDAPPVSLGETCSLGDTIALFFK